MDKDEFVKKYAVERRNTNSEKWDTLKSKFGQDDLLPMWIADMDFSIPPVAKEAMKNRIDEGAFGYSFPAPSYYDAYFAWQKNRYGTELHREWVRLETNVIHTLNMFLQVMTKENDSVMVLEPVYMPFMDAVVKNKRNLVVSELINRQGHYSIDLDDMRQKIEANQVRAIIFCNPHNPVGRVWSEKELEDVLELCRQEQVLVISDEIWHDLMIDGSKFISALTIKDGFYRDNLVVMDSASKTFNMAALLNSHVIIPNPQLMMRFDNYTDRMRESGGALLAQVAEEAAYEKGEDWLNGLLQVVSANYHYLRDEFKKEIPQVVVSPLEGTYLAWIDFSEVIAPEDLVNVMQDKSKIAVDYGDWFGEGGSGHIRLNLATSPLNVKQAVHNLIQAVKNYDG